MMEFRRANRDDIQAFTKVRSAFAASMRTLPDPAGFEDATRAYLEAHIDLDDTVIWLAVENGRIVSTCMACIVQTAPLPSCPNGKSAELLNVYTDPGFRRQGLSEKLIRLLLGELKCAGVQKVWLAYTEMGFPLYKKLGFTPLEDQMQRRL